MPARSNPLYCMVLTTSDSRTLDTDRGGAYARAALEQAGHEVLARNIVADDVTAIRGQVLDAVESGQLDALIVTGGSALGRRDVTPEAIAPLFGKQLPGFGETYRQLAFQAFGPSALLTRACAGSIARTLVFLLPGQPHGVALAMDQLVVPMLHDGCIQIDSRSAGLQD